MADERALVPRLIILAGLVVVLAACHRTTVVTPPEIPGSGFTVRCSTRWSTGGAPGAVVEPHKQVLSGLGVDAHAGRSANGQGMRLWVAPSGFPARYAVGGSAQFTLLDELLPVRPGEKRIADSTAILLEIRVGPATTSWPSADDSAAASRAADALCASALGRLQGTI